MIVSGINMNENNVNNTEVPVQQPAATPVQQPVATPVQQEINKPMQTIDSNEKNINPNAVMEKNINVGANAPTNIDDIQIDTVTIDASTTITAEEYVEKEKYKLTGTADEADLKLDENEKKEEVLDELQIKREVQKENEKFKKDLLYIATFIGIIFIGIAVLPYIVKIVGIKSVN
jgi:hypothetical protein